MQLVLLAILSILFSVSCTKKSSNSTSDAGGTESPPSASNFSTVAKLNADGDCVDPQLDEIKQGVQIMLCDGTIAVGTLALAGASEICNTASQAGVNGTVDCSGSSYQAETGSFIHRDKGITDPTQISLADAKGNDSLPSEYREIPVVATDDFGTPDNATINRVVRGTTEWNGGVPRLVCGMGIATISGRVTDCDTRHATKPDWDKAPTDGAINWQGAVNGNASEGNWTLVSIYKTGASNGDTCDAACYEVWRDDRTGLIWSDRLGDLTVDTNHQSKFTWCVATGNRENDGGIDCRPNIEAGYNEFTDGATYEGISLCAETSSPGAHTYPPLTPDGVGSTADTGSVDAWDNTGSEILDAKGGMRLAANYDPAGSSPVMRWRVPTVHDYFAGLANGVFYVLPHIHYTASPWAEWSASVDADFRVSAWRFFGDKGNIDNDGRNSTYGVRCVGRP